MDIQPDLTSKQSPQRDRGIHSKYDEEKSDNLHNGSRIETSSPKIIVTRAERDDDNHDKDSVVHVLSRNRQFRRPHTEKNEDNLVNAGKHVDDYTIDPRYVPRSIYQFRILGLSRTHARRQYATSTASIEKKAGSDEI